MSILIIYPQLDKPLTGGQVYDFAFIHQLEKIKLDLCKRLVDRELGTGNSFRYCFKYIRRIKYISKFDVIISNSRLYPRLFFLFIFLKLFYAKKNIIVFHHHFNFMTQKGVKRYIHKYIELTLLKTVNTVIIPSPYVRDLMMKYCPSVKIEYLEIAFKHEVDIKVNQRKRNELLFVGSVEPRKGLEFLIKMVEFLAISRLQFHLTIVGKIASQSYYQFLNSMLTEKKVSNYVTFTGQISDDQLKLIYGKSDIFTFPSLHEGYGMVLIEAMSYGLPVVAFDNSAMPYTVKDMSNGLLAENMNADDFNFKVLLLLKNENLLIELSKGAIDTYNKSRTTDMLNREIAQFINNL